MIAALFADRCTGCGRCAEVCPAFVFDPAPEGPPRIARPEDCSTCFLCELYCRADALYVAPEWDGPPALDPRDALAAGLVGRYRKHSGWDEWEAQFPNEHWMMESVFRRAAEASRKG